jgi:hypothetical protein
VAGGGGAGRGAKDCVTDKSIRKKAYKVFFENIFSGEILLRSDVRCIIYSAPSAVERSSKFGLHANCSQANTIARTDTRASAKKFTSV